MSFTTINDPSAHFQTLLYTGNATGSRALTNDGTSNLQPDWLWIKQRNATKNHNVWDSSRGVTKQLRTNLDNAEASNTANDTLVSLDSDGFTLGDDTDSVGVNENSQTYVAWQWKANGGTTTAGGDDDTIATSTHQANTTAGFSIVTYTGEAANKTVKHGLSTTLDVLLVKNRDTAKDWRMWFKDFSGTQRFELNNTEARATTNTSWNNTIPTSSVFTLGNDSNTNTDGDNFIAYCFHRVQGYSKFDAYKGNGSANGAFVYLGFKPAWILVKQIDGADNWQLVDNKRDPINLVDAFLMPDTNSAETTHANNIQVDFLSNGFKCRNTNSVFNGNGNTYIYMAFAESPFVSSKETPTTAR